jgi:hypothetical protein
MKIQNGNITEILQALDRQIGLTSGNLTKILVCGGSALVALKLVSRATKDMDALGIIEKDGDSEIVTRIPSFPAWLEKAIDIVGSEFGLSRTWMNLGPASQIETGLPDGLLERSVKKEYGQYLSVYYISRIDQIYFKLYAAIDNGPGSYHYRDLLSLNPTKDEISDAVKWVITQDVSEPFALSLKDMLRKHGYDDIAEKF